ncbi:MAG: hypothetical protein ACFFCF_02770 [Promethearchaeota archaeon]
MQSSARYTPGATHVQVDTDGNGIIHVVWQEFFEEPDASVYSVIKLRSYSNSSWSPEAIVLSPYTPNLYGYVTYDEYASSPTALTCNDAGQIAIGWFHLGGSSSTKFAGPAFYRFFNGTHWSAVHRFTNNTNIGMFGLKFSPIGILYAVWKEIEDSYGSAWQIYCQAIGSPDPPILLLRDSETETLVNWGHPLELLPEANGRLHFLWGYDSLHYRSYFNGTLSKIQNISTSVREWRAIMDSGHRIHLTWSQYTDWFAHLQNISYCSLYNATWDPTTLIADPGFLIDSGADSEGNVQVLWGYPDPAQYNLNGQAFSTIKPNGSTWSSPTPIQVPALLSQLAMINTTHSHVFSLHDLVCNGFLVHGNSLFYTIIPMRQLFHYHSIANTIISTTLIGPVAPIYFQRLELLFKFHMLFLFVGVPILLVTIIGCLHRRTNIKTKEHEANLAK